jgi:hypothetical protein
VLCSIDTSSPMRPLPAGAMPPDAWRSPPESIGSIPASPAEAAPNPPTAALWNAGDDA